MSGAQAEKFLTALVERYRDNPATYGYDVWNEGSMQECFCPATQAKFRAMAEGKIRHHRSSRPRLAPLQPGGLGIRSSAARRRLPRFPRLAGIPAGQRHAAAALAHRTDSSAR